MYPRFLQIIINILHPNLPTSGITHVLHDPNVFRRINRLGPTSHFNPEVEYDILPWLIENGVDIMEVPTSPRVNSDEEGDYDMTGSIDDNDDGEEGDNIVIEGDDERERWRLRLLMKL